MASSSESHGTHDLNFPVESSDYGEFTPITVGTGTPMTNDKALEAALLPCPFCGGGSVSVHGPRGSMGAWVACTSCGLETPTETGVTTEQAFVYWNRRAPLSALPGEAEVVMEQIAHKEQIGIWANELTSALSLSDFLREDWSFDDSVDLEKEVAAQLLDIIRSAITHTGLNLVASLQAMKARAEAAEALVEKAFRDGLAYGSNTKNADPDVAWAHSRVR